MTWFTYRAEHGSKSKKSCHPHPHSARNRFSRDEERQPGKNLNENDDTDDDTTEDILTTNTIEGM